MKKTFFYKKGLLSLGSDATPLLNTLGDPLYYRSGFLTFISYHDIDINKQVSYYIVPKPRELIFTALPLSIRSFIHRIKVSRHSYFFLKFYEVNLVATADKNRCCGRYICRKPIFGFSSIFMFFFLFYFYSGDSRT